MQHSMFHFAIVLAHDESSRYLGNHLSIAEIYSVTQQRCVRASLPQHIPQDDDQIGLTAYTSIELIE